MDTKRETGSFANIELTTYANVLKREEIMKSKKYSRKENLFDRQAKGGTTNGKSMLLNNMFSEVTAKPFTFRVVTL